MNKLIILGRIYKNGSLGTSRKEKEDSINIQGFSFGSTAERIDLLCKSGDQVLMFGFMEKDKKNNSLKFVATEFQRTGQNKSDQPNEETINQDTEEEMF